MGSKEGAEKARARALAKNPNHFRDAGRNGGLNGNTGGFANSKELAIRASALGLAARRAKSKYRRVE
jgi:general stress protein YciG